MDIGPGDWVECINAGPSKRPGWEESDDGHRRLTLGAIYRVERIIDDGIIIGPKSNHWSGGWDLARFKPIYRPKADLIEQLSKPVVEELVRA